MATSPQRSVEVIYYDWISEGDIEVYVGDIEFDEDEKAIHDQISAIGMGWVDK